jgi:hypothetical protein
VSLTLLVLGGAGLCWTVIWIVGRFSRPAALNKMSDSWIDAHKYDRKHTRAE